MSISHSPWIIIVLTVLLGACTPPEEESVTPGADLILTNGKIYTMNPAREWAEAVAIQNGRILAVGSSEAISQHRGKATKVVDLQKKMVLPSFQDVHIHPISGGLAYTGCALFESQTLEQVLDEISRCARDNPDADHILGYGWNWGMFIDQGEPHKQLLDAIDSTRPLVVGDSDGHTLWVNS